MGSNAILVVGGGFSGITAALEAAEVGHEVFIVEKNPFLGGRVMQLNKYFPKLCPPSCGLEIQFQRIKNNKRVKFFTQAEVVKVTGRPGDYEVTVKIRPRYVEPGSVNLAETAEKLSKDIVNEFDFGLGTRKALYMLLGCKYGDDYQCHFVKGSEICNRRKENIAESLKRLGVEPERVEQYQVAIDEYDKIPGMIDRFMDMVLKIGPNPFKGY